jgi:hypothetical protein
MQAQPTCTHCCCHIGFRVVLQTHDSTTQTTTCISPCPLMHPQICSDGTQTHLLLPAVLQLEANSYAYGEPLRGVRMSGMLDNRTPTCPFQPKCMDGVELRVYSALACCPAPELPVVGLRQANEPTSLLELPELCLVLILHHVTQQTPSVYPFASQHSRLHQLSMEVPWPPQRSRYCVQLLRMQCAKQSQQWTHRGEVAAHNTRRYKHSTGQCMHAGCWHAVADAEAVVQLDASGGTSDQ